MVPERAREPFAATLTAAAIGQAMIAGGSVLARAVADLPSHQLDAVSVGTFYGTLALGAGACAWWARRLREGTPKLRMPLDDPRNGPTEFPPDVAGGQDPAAVGPTDPFVARLRDVIGSQPIDVVGEPVRDEDGVPVGFTVRATKPGLFTHDRKRTDVFMLLTKSIDGTWDMRADLQNDTLVFCAKAGFPAVITPPIPETVPQSVDEARSMYPDFRMRLGVTATGDSLDIDLRKIPHALVIGSTGSGKSAFARTILESFRAAGWMVFLGDGKGVDYEGLHRQPGVVAISQREPDHVRLVRMVHDELMARQADAKARKRRGEADPFHRPPLLLLLDEYAVMRARIKATYGIEEFERDLTIISQLGREFKVHLILSTQDAYRETVPGQLLGNLNLRISLGPPEDKTIKEVFPESLRNEAARIGGGISKNDRGRSLALITDEDGDNQAVEFQAYYGYSPAETKTPPNAEVAALWERYKTAASDRIRLLYPRLWFAVDGPDYGEGLEGLYALPVVVLTGRDGRPVPQSTKYDPLSDDYLGGATGSGAVFYALDELPEHIAAPELDAPTIDPDQDGTDLHGTDPHETDSCDEQDCAGPDPEDRPQPDVTPTLTDPDTTSIPSDPPGHHGAAIPTQPDPAPKRLIPKRHVGI